MLAAASDGLLDSFDHIVLEAHGLLHDDGSDADAGDAGGRAREQRLLAAGRADATKAAVLERLAARHVPVHARRPQVVCASFLPWTGLLAGEVVPELLELTYVRRAALTPGTAVTPADPPRAAAGATTFALPLAAAAAPPLSRGLQRTAQLKVKAGPAAATADAVERASPS